MKKCDWTERVVMWRRALDDQGFELMAVTRLGQSYRFQGTAFMAEAGVPSRVDYLIHCDGAWQTRQVRVRQVLGGDAVLLALTATRGKWHRNGLPAPELDGCTDIDLAISPSTNALPINRLRIPLGEAREIRAAWVRFPQCIVEAAQQSYERLARNRYLYRSMSSDFTATIEVDDTGLPIDYSGIWRRVASTEETGAARMLKQSNLIRLNDASARRPQGAAKPRSALAVQRDKPRK